MDDRYNSTHIFTHKLNQMKEDKKYMKDFLLGAKMGIYYITCTLLFTIILFQFIF